MALKMAKYLPESLIGLFDKSFFVGTLFMIDPLLNTLASAIPGFARELEGKDMSVQLKIRNNTKGRQIFFREGKVSGRNGVYDNADVEMIFESEKIYEAHQLPVGTVVTDGKKYIKVAVPDGFVSVLSLQLPGKKRLKTDELLRGFRLSDGYKMN